MKQAIFLVIVFILLNSFSCNKGYWGFDNRVKVSNKTSKSIYYTFGNAYSDTLIPGYPPLRNLIYDSITLKALPFKDNILSINGTWEEIFDSIKPKDKLCFFIFDADVIEHGNWDSTKLKYKILRRYDYSLDSLKRMNWTIVYQ